MKHEFKKLSFDRQIFYNKGSEMPIIDTYYEPRSKIIVGTYLYLYVPFVVVKEWKDVEPAVGPTGQGGHRFDQTRTNIAGKVMTI